MQDLPKLEERNLFFGFASYFPDNALLMTTYPIGERIETQMFNQVYAKHQLDAAYRYHREQLSTWSEIHGKPISFCSFADGIRFSETIYQPLYRSRHLRRIWISALNFGLLCSLFAVVFVLGAVLLSYAMPDADAKGHIARIYRPEWMLWATRVALLGIVLSMIAAVVIRLTHRNRPIDSPPPHPERVRGQHPLHTNQAAPPPF